MKEIKLATGVDFGNGKWVIRLEAEECPGWKKNYPEVCISEGGAICLLADHKGKGNYKCPFAKDFYEKQTVTGSDLICLCEA